MSTYAGIVCRIQVRKHPNADKLQLGIVQGNQVVVGLDTKDGELGIFFPCDGQLSDQFCVVNDLYPRFDDQNRRIGGGFFDPKNRRVRAQSFRGEKSEGFWCPISYLNGLLFREVVDNLKEGDQFTELNGVQICCKYETQATKDAAAKGPKAGTAAKKHEFFKEHADTKQLAYEIQKIPVGSVIHLSEKLHGTSGRYAFFIEKAPITGWRNYLIMLVGFVTGVFKKMWNTERKLLVGSRRVQLKSEVSPTSYYGDESFRFAVAKKLEGNIRLGETVYGELVGYQGPNTPIMGRVETSQLSDKEFKKTYGDTMTYKYGCPEGTSKFFVYRITQTNEDGHAIDLTVPQILARCKVLGFEYVPEFSGPLVVVPGSPNMEAMGITFPLVCGGQTGHVQSLQKLVETFLDGPSTLDSSHIREGVVVRVDAPNGDTYFLKSKSFNFKVLEGIIKDQADYVDTEESA